MKKNTTGALRQGIEEALRHHPSVQTFVGFFGWLAVEKRISRSLRRGIVEAGSNPVVAYLQSQVCLHMGVEAEEFIIPSFYVSESEQSGPAEVLDARAFHGPKARVTALEFGLSEGELPTPLLSRRYFIG